MQRILALGYALVAYLIFFASFVWLILFTGNLPYAPTTVDRAIDGAPIVQALLVNLGLIALFGLQHSIMARQPFKARWTKLVPASVERATYVLAASIALILILRFWHTLPGQLWDVRGSAGEPVIWAIFAIGWAILFVSTWLINHFELFGLLQAWRHGQKMAAATPPVLREPLFYKYVRHPLYLGFAIAFWATPHMTGSHLLLAVAMTLYILIGIAHEERDLVAHFGPAYDDYRKRVGMLIPGMGRHR
ncbi:MAG: methanethiol S-methyltransferase [Sphingomicrobium sp.]